MKKALVSLVLGVTMATANAAWPEKPVTMIVPFPPGGSTDNIARILSAKFQQTFGGSFVVDNRPGAAGMIGAAAAKRAPADGYTLFVSSLGPFVIGPHLTKTAGYDPTKDFDYISVAVQAPNILAVPASSPHKSLQDVINYEKANPNKMTFASAGNGTSDHLTAELFWQQTNTTGVHVPYKGGAPALNDLLGSQVDATFMNINTAVPHLKAGKLRALAITSSKRSPILPDVPTMEELGYKGVTVYSWQAIAAPKGLPADIKAKLHSAVVAAMNDPANKPKLLELGFEVVANTPEQFTAFQASEFARWKKVIQTGNITAD
ncbi:MULTISPECIES: tripartite tricarboxylate transporter substrate binding protein [unclassified Cupriavidus]|uniref:Bug family tripartite tricarboxylate transporter substrate binding protein n=1 Tax=unclassified Cupriavidus TaxID=2640874 RepID=UPI001C002BFD|nr:MULTISPECIES: tripartite tricarboxylate transporter substrate binding protein [unclassified Cupriavidus]MCA3184253.1 tripartite tricarboxylate transporter substrate binding protein [Cupriavidus sp.]MCA3191909.1 tripartite tricarboxylate transporter substrate binding protein [Cupriavidus sp.]MCA3197654.1 tripartite tricarboxylate transporter substrate binding protein [Cupriavidus sp.]MCA3202706.1 tripartite tricarboxylate transporter substrate binding protein [Cupriavidus sp.]MCA3208380.1 tr